jgi:hypothetical protein
LIQNNLLKPLSGWQWMAFAQQYEPSFPLESAKGTDPVVFWLQLDI